LEQIKGISEQKATKILVEGKPTPSLAELLLEDQIADENELPSCQISTNGFYNGNGNARQAK
jgi:hypothetical protein